jgi:phosphate transport system permease protein
LQGKGSKKNRNSEKIVEAILLICGFSSIAVVFLLFGYVAVEGYPAIVDWILHGFGMTWDGINNFGISVAIFNTFYVGVGALAISTAVGLPVAIYIAEFAGSKLRNFIKPSMETLAGIPSIAVGYFGFFFIAPIVVAFFGESATNGLCVLTAWLVLAVMALPFMVSLSEDAIKAVPNSYREASHGLGATKWQTALHIVLPEAKIGILAASLLTLSTILGETIAVTMVIGGTANPNLTLNPLGTSSVLTTLLASNINQDFTTARVIQGMYGASFMLLVIIGSINLAITLIATKKLKKRNPQRANRA